MALPFYVAWLFATCGGFALSIPVAAQLGLVAMDVVVLLLAAAVTPRVSAWSLQPYVPGFGL